jgi:isocitrate lyase
VLVPTSTHISRLIASRFQLDLMKSMMLLIARTDSESAKLLSSNIDVVDHEFILGTTTTKGIYPLAQVLSEAEAKGENGNVLDRLEREWTASHEMCTFNQGKANRLFRVPFFKTLIQLLKRPFNVRTLRIRALR